MKWIEEAKKALELSSTTFNETGLLLQIDRNSIVGEKLANALEVIEKALAVIPDDQPIMGETKQLEDGRTIVSTGPAREEDFIPMPDEPKAGYKRAKGIIPWQEGDELPEETIRRMRGGSEAEMLGVLRLVKDIQDRAIELFNSGKPASYFNVYDALLYVSEYIEDELGYRLSQEVEDTDEYD